MSMGSSSQESVAGKKSTKRKRHIRRKPKLNHHDQVLNERLAHDNQSRETEEENASSCGENDGEQNSEKERQQWGGEEDVATHPNDEEKEKQLQEQEELIQSYRR